MFVLVCRIGAMSAEKAAKLKLKKKKGTSSSSSAAFPNVAETGGSILQPGLSQRPSSAGSWFDEINLTAAEQMWKRVLNAAHPDLANVGWDSVPGLPEFGDKNIKKALESAGYEVFNVGQEKLEWFPFPTDLLDHGLDKNSVQILDSYADNGKNNEPSSLDGVISSAKVAETWDSVGRAKSDVSADSIKPKNKPIPKKKHFKEPQVPEKKTVIEKLFSAKMSKDGKINSSSQDSKVADPQVQETKSNDIVMRDVSEEGSKVRVSGARETEDRAAEAPGSLESCPMCLTQFPKQLSQLDIDSHLAQCLAETAIDVTW
ncbi:Fanconi anemia core complex-associated protein 20 [Spea bombifrons]|uniref:Fanconi anemia core complex-associated protein 20 n=1 Tax=Spea bombifrons TaxID=233779 RepID=UPI00234BBED4|nr:Fanconi anemia core complex-associated protein 20 [Spea bombifrons]